MRLILVAAALLATGVEEALSCGTTVCVGSFCKCADISDPTQLKPSDVIKAAFPGVGPILDAAQNSGDQNLVAAAQNLAMIGAKLDKETQTAISNALTNPAQGIKDAVQTHIKAANDIVDAVHASARYAERTVSGYQDVLTKAESRIREGKVVDAIWHIQTDALKTDNENAAKLMQESEVARQAAQGAASAYGGPAGSAAFAAWYAYNSSQHNVELALRAGAYTYVVSAGYAEVNAMPSGTVDEIARKAAATAAVRGMAVAAAGGSQQDILNAAAKGGGSVVVQSGEEYVTKEYVDPAKAKADTFCVNAVGASCADARQWVDYSTGRLEQYRAAVDALPNTITTDDGQWVISWDKQVLLDPNSKAPGVVLTYIGKGSPYEEQMLRLAAIGDPTKFAPPVIVSASWAAFRAPIHAPDAGPPYFDHVPPGATLPVRPGDLLKANTAVNVRTGASGGGWLEPIDTISGGELVKVLEVETADTEHGPQEWFRFDRVQPSFSAHDTPPQAQQVARCVQWGYDKNNNRVCLETYHCTDQNGERICLEPTPPWAMPVQALQERLKALEEQVKTLPTATMVKRLDGELTEIGNSLGSAAHAEGFSSLDSRLKSLAGC